MATMIQPYTGAVVEVDKEQVDRFEEAGWTVKSKPAAKPDSKSDAKSDK